MGGILGSTTAVALRWAWPVVSRKGQLGVLIGWSIGGVASASVIDYNVLIGWSVLATVGATVTALTAFGGTRPATALQNFGFVIGCVLGGVGGAVVASRAGIEVGTLLSLVMRGRALPYIVWATASGIGGVIAGLVGGWSLFWRMRRQSLSHS